MNTVHDTLTCSQDFVVGNHDDPDKLPRMEIILSPVGPVRDIAERAYAAGCDAIEFHRADCQEEVDAIMRDVMSKPMSKPEPVLFEDVIAVRVGDAFDRVEEVNRFISLVMAAAASTPGQADDVDYEAGVVTVELDGYGPTDRLKIPAHLLLGMDPRYVPAIVENYVEAYRAGIEAPGVSRRDFERIANLLDFAAARLVSKGDKEIIDFVQGMRSLSAKLAVAVGRAS